MMHPSVSTLIFLACLSTTSFAQGKDVGWDVSAPDLPLRTLKFEVTEGTWISSDVSSKGEIVFDLLGDLYVIPMAGGTARCIRSGLSWDIQPRWSPDGKMIAFTSDASGGDNIWVMNADGGGARAVTKERFRLLNNPAWSPDGKFLVARKHFTGTRSLGAGEMWLYPTSGGPGVGLTTRRTQQKDAGEPVFAPDGKALFWSEDVTPGQTFDYNKDPNGEIYVIFRKDLVTGEVRRQVAGNGGAVRPQPSPDGRSLAFVRRMRTKTALCIQDLATKATRVLYEELSRDAQETWAIFGVHPGFSWTADSRAIVTSAKGRLLSIDVASRDVTPIPFRAPVELRIAETLRVPKRLGGEDFPVKVCRGPTVSPDGQTVAFHALGRIWMKPLVDGKERPVTGDASWALDPAWSPDGKTLAFTTWDDELSGRVCLLRGETVTTLVEAPGHYRHPVFSPDGTELLYQRVGGDDLRGSAFTLEPGIYRVAVAGGAPVRVLESGSRPTFHGSEPRILFEESQGDDLVLVSVNWGGFDRREIARSQYATEFELSPDGRWLAFTELWNAYVCRLPTTGDSLRVSRDMTSVPLTRLSNDAGEDLSFSADGTKVYHGLAHELREQVLEGLFAKPFGTAEMSPKGPNFEATARRIELGFTAQAAVPRGEMLLENARVVTMAGGMVLEKANIHVRGERIVGVYEENLPTLPEGIHRVDLTGRTVVPGFIDLHAHIRHGANGLLPERNWQHLANLSFGITTTHDPSNDTKTTFAAAELQRTGRILAPRIFSTGTILYGAEGDFKAVVDSLDDARSHIRRTAAFGAFTVKSYNQPRRDQRQQILKAARELGVMVVPEGGSTLQHNLNQIVDGHTTLEHALPVAPLYDDVLTLFSRSGTAYTPTLIVGYGGIWGENWWYQKTEAWKNERLLRWMPRHLLDARARRRTMAPDEEYNHQELARMAFELARRGTPVEVGAHGQIQGLGVHWELGMFAQGGMKPMDVLRTATVWPARALGLDQDLGTIEVGKLADLTILARNPLDDLTATQDVVLVVLGGRLFDATTLDQIWPDRIPLPKGPNLDPTSPASERDQSSCPCLAH